MSEYGYEFYLRECDKEGNFLAESERKSLEQDFKGLRYSKIDGIEAIGAPKNVYS
jgi:hypothetical protein